MSFEPYLYDKIKKEFIDSGSDARYKLHAYSFVLNGLEFYLAKIGEKRHVSGKNLAEGLVEFAYRQFGPLAINVLWNWGIYKTDDFGFIVFNLIKTGTMSRQESDTLEDFFNLFSMEEYFKQIDYYNVDKNYIRTIQGA
jgi:uncharacterized repeat protein (TIGR04138 family)